VGQAVAFSSAGSSDADGTITSYQWTFGDGTNGTGTAPSRIYSSTGNYIVTLTVTDNSGNARRASTLVVVSSSQPNEPSSLTAGSPSAGAVTLAWQDRSSNELRFRIERSTSATTGFIEVGTVGIDTTTFTEQGLLRGKVYYYRVRAANSSGNSGYSNTVSVKTQ
jgi:PKD repeat protein